MKFLHNFAEKSNT